MTEEPGKYNLDSLLDQPSNRMALMNPYFIQAAKFADSILNSGQFTTPEEVAEYAIELTEKLIEGVKDK